MDEREWETEPNVLALLLYLRGKASQRKFRLFACDCARRTWHAAEAGVPRALSLAEDCAEGMLSVSNLIEFASGLGARGGYSPAWALNQAEHALVTVSAADAADSSAQSAMWYVQLTAAERAGDGASSSVGKAAALAARTIETLILANRLRCIFGNPFRPVALDPSWRTEAVVALAAGVYADRAFDRLPVLADALEDAGCANADVLAHCRGPGPHARGCWVVDLLLGKA